MIKKGSKPESASSSSSSSSSSRATKQSKRSQAKPPKAEASTSSASLIKFQQESEEISKRLNTNVAKLEKDPYRLEYQSCTFEMHHNSKSHHGNCNHNPNCLYGLGEITGDIWSNDHDKLLKSKLGASPIERKRGTDDASGNLIPVGLVNLGATCYVNSLLQVLFFDTEFRSKLFEWENPMASSQIHDLSGSSSSSSASSSSTTTSSTSTTTSTTTTTTTSSSSSSPSSSSSAPQHSVGVKIAHELRSLFGHLQNGYGASFNPRALISTLQISTGVQQDAQEFNKLLLSFFI